MNEPVVFWIGFIAFVIVMLLLDLFVFHKKNEVIKVKSALLWSAFWIGLALLFNLGIYFFSGHQQAINFFTGYLIEESLSVDNLFVFIMIFAAFSIEPKYQHRILFWGIIGAIVMRAVFIFAGIALIEKFARVMYVFGIFLIYTGIKMLFEKEEGNKPIDLESNKMIKFIKYFFPVTIDNKETNFFKRINGKLYATQFLLTLLMIEGSDLIFAVDSIPAVMSVSTDPFIVYTSNIFAILGLRSLYFALSGIMGYFRYLKYGLAFILSFIGLKMCINELANEMEWHFHISNMASLGVIVEMLTISIVASIIKTNREKRLNSSC
ncbi:MAG: TerC family protein [Dysgonamonadaceae bacterium]|jgi:tellurite resistance protein TerC|nr:TerC family protein [Dysgonamonadaceae bacterium]